MKLIELRIKELRTWVDQHDALYDAGTPKITDSEYDALYLELEALEKKYPQYFDAESPTQKIKTTIVEGLRTVRHRTPMLSQQKLTTEDDVKKFVAFAGEGQARDFLVQEKLDGITIVLAYENGRLVEAVSRGNGEEGEDLLHNVRTFTNLPTVIEFKERLEMRAEAVLPFEDFRRINVDGKYSNPRNLVSGSLRQLDSSSVVGMGFKAIVFDLVHAEGLTDESFEYSDLERLKFLKYQGFEVVRTDSFHVEDSKEIMSFIENFGKTKRASLPHMIDGMVIKLDDLYARNAFGYTSKHPKWAAAFKFKSLDATTKLLAITDQVGKTGQITPVAELETVNIDGVNISRASLHNYELLAKKDLRIGDTVIVERANDVIPQVVKSIAEERDGNEIVKIAPAFCPVCGSVTEQNGENLYCTGIDCTPQIAGKLQHYVSRDAMNIDGLGEKTVELLYEQGFISNILDIYHLEDKKAGICELEGFGEKKFEKMIQGIEESKKRPLPNLFHALSIRNTGLGSAKRISRIFHSLDELIGLSRVPEQLAMEKLLMVEDFGDIKASSVYKFFTDEHNLQILRGLMEVGVNPVMEKVEADSNNKIAGMTFVITGSLETFGNRKELEAKIEEMGGKVSGSVSKNTNYLINNDKESNSSKNKKAKDLGVGIISEKDLLEML